LWILAIIIPNAALGRFSPQFRRAFNTIFAPLWIHILMHTLLYIGVCALIILTFRLPRSARTMAITLGIVFVVGLLQEGLQAFNQGTFLLGGSIEDFAVDLLGG
jgi:hypothetical protein